MLISHTNAHTELCMYVCLQRFWFQIFKLVIYTTINEFLLGIILYLSQLLSVLHSRVPGVWASELNLCKQVHGLYGNLLVNSRCLLSQAEVQVITRWSCTPIPCTKHDSLVLFSLLHFLEVLPPLLISLVGIFKQVLYPPALQSSSLGVQRNECIVELTRCPPPNSSVYCRTPKAITWEY